MCSCAVNIPFSRLCIYQNENTTIKRRKNGNHILRREKQQFGLKKNEVKLFWRGNPFGQIGLVQRLLGFTHKSD